jgi:hypothetical protein
MTDASKIEAKNITSLCETIWILGNTLFRKLCELLPKKNLPLSCIFRTNLPYI